jgi:ABC-type multidrug transport system fused ATPase/permease subunit
LLIIAVGNATPALAPILTFGITLALNKDKEGGPLSLSTAFTSLSIMSLIMQPLSHMLYAIPSIISAFSIFERVEEFFEKAEEHTPSSSEDAQSMDRCTQDGIPLQPVSVREIVATNASFAAKLGDAALLQDINFSVRPGTLTMITGKVGSGKSLLLQGLLGELLLMGGALRKDIASIGYCAQSAWLVKGTVRRNIIGWSSDSEDKDWYDTVVKACALDKDFQQFSSGDQTRLSSKGLSLSGGQRHRVVRFTIVNISIQCVMLRLV